MKLHEILPEPLEERAFRKALAAGIVGATMAVASGKAHAPQPQHAPVTQIAQHDQGPPEPSREEIQLRQRPINMAKQIAQRFRIKQELALDVVRLAHKYEDPVFPTAEDILAVVGVESSFNPDSVSKLRQDPARGLMQVRPGVNAIDVTELTDVEGQIKHGADILKRYYNRLGDKDAAVQAYNIGITNFRQGGTNPRYLGKVRQERGWYDDLTTG